VAKVLGPKSLDKIFPKETTIQRKEICEEEALEKCTNVPRKTHTHTHTHTPNERMKAK
jgi:hypothetical protein